MNDNNAGAQILVIDDESAICISCKRILQEDGHKVDFSLSGREGVKKAVAGNYAIVLLDLKMPDLNGMEALEMILKEKPDQTIIIITGYASIQTSIEAIKKGAFDYVPKPFTPEELSLAVSKAMEDKALRRENQALKQELSNIRKGGKMIGRSKAMEDILNQIYKIAPTDFTVMVYGESGSGKELIAQTIHENSLRMNKTFVAVDISSLTASLIESELFGHVKGAFTGASTSRPGYFSIAHGGTLFLDEISNISWELQGKLLRVIETRKVRPVGSEQEHDVDVRIIAATNKDLYDLVKEGKFREDLYYRLNVIPLTIPPLRDRSDDIPLLAIAFLKKAAEANRSPIKGFTTEAMAKLISYPWPGNVRQIKNIVERLVATVDSELIGVDALPPEIRGAAPQPAEVPIESQNVPKTADELKEMKQALKDKIYGQIERDFVLDALNRSGWNVTKASELVGMLRPNFHALMRKYGIRARDEE